MNITLEKVSNVNAVITVNIVKADYETLVKKTLKTYGQKVQMPGFRPGKVPSSLINKMYGVQAKSDEINKLLSDKLFEYIRENQVNMLGEPLPSENQKIQDIAEQDDFEFIFDIALAPEFEVSLNNEDNVPYYDIEVSNEQLDNHVNQIAQRSGHSENVDSYIERDILRGVLAELDENGSVKEGGLVVESVSLMPTYFKNDEQKNIFSDAKVNDVVVFNPSKAYEGSDAEVASLLKIKKEEVASYAGNFSFQVETISRYVPAELNQELFDQVFGEGVVANLEEFRLKVKEQIQLQQSSESDYKF